MNDSTRELFHRIPKSDELYGEGRGIICGIYNNRVFTYLRSAGLGQSEYLVVANGRVVEHYITNRAGTFRRDCPEFVCQWAWEIGIKSRLGFVSVSSQSLYEWMCLHDEDMQKFDLWKAQQEVK